MSKGAQFLLRSAGWGLIAAALILWLKPEWLDWSRPRVEINERQAAPAPAPAAAGAVNPLSYADAVARAAPAVVNVYTAKLITERVHPLFEDPLFQRFFGEQLAVPRQRLETSLGSGVIVSKEGYVLTNNHVIEGADEVRVLLADKRAADARIVGTDPDSDLAVLRIELTDLPSVVLGRSDTMRVGDVVLAIGNPFGVGQTVTHGIVSAIGRNRLGINAFEDFIQTDAPINPGNSGGALVSADGDLVGINTAIFTRSGGSQGIGFAIPVALAKGIMQQIIEHGEVVRGWLGLETQDLTPELAESFGLESARGVVVAGVLRDGPADRAGLKPGDVLLRIGERPVEDAPDALGAIANQPPGSRIEIAGMRAGEPFTLDAEIARRPAQRQRQR